MELWLNLLFGNPVGLFSVIALSLTVAIFCYIIWMFVKKSGEGSDNQ